MEEKRKLLYLMHIDWNWIKQRPQYIEESLEAVFDVTIFCPRNYRLKEYHDKPNIKVFYSIPFIRRYPGIWMLDQYRKKIIINHLIQRTKPDVIFSTSPEYADCIPPSFTGTVAYD